MDYFAGLDISMDETHVCVLDREGVVVCESKSESTAAAIAIELSKAQSCRRIVFETGRTAPIVPVERGVYTLAESEPSRASALAVVRRPLCSTPHLVPTGTHSEQGFPSSVGHRQYADERDR
jgi:hypothetical protein